MTMQEQKEKPSVAGRPLTRLSENQQRKDNPDSEKSKSKLAIYPVCNTGVKMPFQAQNTCNVDESENQSARLDWITFIGREETFEKAYLRVAIAVGLTAAEMEEVKETEINQHGYQWGWNIAGVSVAFGHKVETCYWRIQVQGVACDRLGMLGAVRLMRQMDKLKDTQVRRCDVAIDLYDDQSMGLMRQIKKSVDQGELCRVRDFSEIKTEKAGKISGWTMYLGSRQSGAMVRVYDKGLETGKFNAGVWVRIEAEFKKEKVLVLADTLKNMSDTEWIKYAIEQALSVADFRIGDQKRLSRRERVDWWQKIINLCGGIQSDRLSVDTVVKDYDRKYKYYTSQVRPWLAELSLIHEQETGEYLSEGVVFDMLFCDRRYAVVNPRNDEASRVALKILRDQRQAEKAMPF